MGAAADRQRFMTRAGASTGGPDYTAKVFGKCGQGVLSAESIVCREEREWERGRNEERSEGGGEGHATPLPALCTPAFAHGLEIGAASLGVERERPHLQEAEEERCPCRGPTTPF